jgi:hypothetical protein
MGVTALAEACADLTAWLPHARALITEPDTTPAEGHAQPGSRPPWNTAAANACLDIHAAARQLEQDLRHAVTGTHLERGGSDANTALALAAIHDLAEAIGPAEAGDVARMVGGWLTAILMLPAVDLEEPWRPVPAPCPRCTRPMLRARPRSTGQVACLGCSARGRMRPGTISAGYIEWDDGEIA